MISKSFTPDELSVGYALTQIGVSRISYGLIPYIHAMDALEQEASKVHKDCVDRCEIQTGRFTFYVTVDPPFVLDLASRCGVSADDRRVRELVRSIETRRGPDGLWQHPAHPPLSRWLAFDLEGSLRRLTDGDWIGNEAPAPSPPSNNPRRRY